MCLDGNRSEGQGEDAMNIKAGTAAALAALGLLAACEAGAPGTTSANPMTASDDTLVDETEADDPMEPGAIDDAIGTQIPGA
jgi:hypothetical protein